MLNPKGRLIAGSRVVVQIAMIVNRVFLVAVVTGLVLSFLFPAKFAALMVQPHPGREVQAVVRGMRWVASIGIVMAVVTEILLRALTQIVASVGEGDPFTAANARRLRTIGWALLALQLVDLPAALIGRLFPSLGSAAPALSFSPGGWIAVLMVFVLSRVFAAGTAMRDDLEGTV